MDEEDLIRAGRIYMLIVGKGAMTKVLPRTRIPKSA